MTETRVAADYDRWLTGRSPSAWGYKRLASLPGMILVNTPAFRLPTELQITPAMRLLDIGCGRGSLLQVLQAKVAFERPPVGLDLSAAMLRLARRDAARGHPLALLQASAVRLPLATSVFDLVTCAYVVKHLDDNDLLRFFAEVKRVLTPGGIALIWEFAAVESERRNAFSRRLLTPGVGECNLRDYTMMNAYALAAGFEWAGNAALRPFLFPPIPRVSILVGKAPPEYLHHDDD